MSELEKMVGGRLYDPSDREILQKYLRAKKILDKFNGQSNFSKRKKLLFKLIKGGDSALVLPPFYCDYGFNIEVGEGFFANHGCVILDVCPVKIGKGVLLGPCVGIYTAAHPLKASDRATGLEYGKSIEIGDDVWIGGGAIINPGVKIGKGSVIGSGSVVVKDIPEFVIAAGNPCKVIRQITDEDGIEILKNKQVQNI